MEGHHHSIISEFPEMKEKIHELKVKDAHFRGLLEKFEEVDKKIARSESRIEICSEEAEETMKKERLSIKDQIFAMLSAS